MSDNGYNNHAGINTRWYEEKHIKKFIQKVKEGSKIPEHIILNAQLSHVKGGDVTYLLQRGMQIVFDEIDKREGGL